MLVTTMEHKSSANNCNYFEIYRPIMMLMLGEPIPNALPGTIHTLLLLFTLECCNSLTTIVNVN